MSRDFLLHVFFLESSFSKSQIFLAAPPRIFLESLQNNTFAAQGGTNFKKRFSYFVETLLFISLDLQIDFFPNCPVLGVDNLILRSMSTAGDTDTGSKFTTAPAWVTPVAIYRRHQCDEHTRISLERSEHLWYAKLRIFLAPNLKFVLFHC